MTQRYLEPIGYTMAEAGRITGHGATKLYDLAGRGVLDARKAGRRTIIMADSLRAYMASLPRADIRPQHRKAA